jgi:hypothetical protein
MLELRPNCENCNKPLPYNVDNAMICSFECTFCENCAKELLKNVCPNCGGGFQRRPIRPANKIEEFPASTKYIHKPVALEAHKQMIAKRNALPEVKQKLQY